MPPPPRAAAPLGISYRPADDADLPFLSQVYASTRVEELAPTGWPDGVKQQFLEHQFGAQHRHYRQQYPAAEWLIILWSGEAIGRFYLEEWPDQFRIIDIALLPHARGQGVGTAILADMVAAARKAGKSVSIHVEKNNPAMRLYQRLGFVQTDEHGIYDLMVWNGRAEPA
ncbi:MAG TPA: GNAT family N-acetyltransferase [Allosphingosinicella sp.]|jgi:ribosomal protein S18 acetylase RimI-like enzyme